MIYLRDISEKDIEIINSFRSSRELIGSLLAPFRYINIESDKEWFRSYQATRNNNIRCVICIKETNEIIGVVYLLNINWIVRSGELNIFIGDKKWRRKRFGEMAANEILQHAFMDLNLNMIQLKVLESNVQAISFYKKLGFQVEGVLRQSVFKDNKYVNSIVMSLLKKEFQSK